MKFPSANEYAEQRGLQRPNKLTGFRNEDKQIPADSATPPYPGSESAGPALYDLVQRTSRALEVQHELIRHSLVLMEKRFIVQQVSGETDANGNLDLRLFEIPQGFKLQVARVNVEAGTFTPASPFSAANAWMALIRGLAFAPGCILNFGPAVAAGPLLPGIFSESTSHAPIVLGGDAISLHIVGTATLANIAIWARLQGLLLPA